MIDPALEIAIAGLPPNVNESRRRHWSSVAKDAAAWRRTAKLTAIGAMRLTGHADSFPIAPARLELVYLLAAVRGDLDNLIAASKPIIDGLVDARAITDDSVRWTREIRATWRRSSQPGVLVRIRYVED